MNFNAYKMTVLTGIRQVTNYRAEMWVNALSRFISLSGMILLWMAISRENKNINFRVITGYLLVATSIRDLLDAQYLKLSKEFIEEVKHGTIGSHILRPINTRMFFYCRFLGDRLLNILIDLVVLSIGLYLNPVKNIAGLFFFCLSVTVGMGVSYCLNILVGSISFWATDALNFRNVVNHITRVFSGSLIPITFFPGVTKDIVLLLPFPSLAFLPATFLSSTTIDPMLVASLLVSFVWMLILFRFSQIVWERGLKHYDGAGI